jgi:hypothetical protein
MGKRAEQQGGNSSSGTRATGHGWTRPGFLSMPTASNDNRITPRLLLRQPRFWIWVLAMGVLAAWLYGRV